MIYFIQHPDDKYIKIGYSNKPRIRLSQLRRQYGDGIVVLGIHDGDLSREKALHTEFSSDNRFGEWFMPSARLMDYITEHARPLEHPQRSARQRRRPEGGFIVNRVPELLAQKFGGKDKINLTQVQLDTRMTHTAVRRWATNKVTRYDHSALDTWCRYFNCQVGDLLVYRGTMIITETRIEEGDPV